MARTRHRRRAVSVAWRRYGGLGVTAMRWPPAGAFADTSFLLTSGSAGCRVVVDVVDVGGPFPATFPEMSLPTASVPAIFTQML